MLSPVCPFDACWSAYLRVVFCWPKCACFFYCAICGCLHWCRSCQIGLWVFLWSFMPCFRFIFLDYVMSFVQLQVLICRKYASIIKRILELLCLVPFCWIVCYVPYLQFFWFLHTEICLCMMFCACSLHVIPFPVLFILDLRHGIAWLRPPPCCKCFLFN